MPASDFFIKSDEAPWESGDEGITRQILGHDLHLMLVRVRFEPGAVGATHNHPHRQVSYVESGSFAVEIDGEKEVLRAGDCFFVPPDAMHGAVALEEGCLIDVFTPARESFLGGVDPDGEAPLLP